MPRIWLGCLPSISLWLISTIIDFLYFPGWTIQHLIYGPFTRYVKLRVAHAPVMPGTFFPPPQVSDPDMHHGTCVTHVLWCMLGSLVNGFLWTRGGEGTFPAFLAHAQPTILPIWQGTMCHCYIVGSVLCWFRIYQWSTWREKCCKYVSNV